MGHVVRRIFVLLVLMVVVVYSDNATTPPPGAPPAGAVKHGGAVSSVVKMLIDIPMGIVEAFKDGADAIESMVVGFMRGVF